VPLAGKEILVETLLNDAAFSVRRMALKASLSLSRPISLTRLAGFLKDANPWVRKEAVETARKMSQFDVNSLLDGFKGEKNPSVIETYLDFFIDRSVHGAIPVIIQKIKEKPEEELPRLLQSMGLLEARELLPDMKKYLPADNPEAWKEFFCARLQHGDTQAAPDLINLLQEKTRDDEALFYARVIGETAWFLRNPGKFSAVLAKAIGQETNTPSAGPQPVTASKKTSPIIPVEEPEEPIEAGIELYDAGDFEKALFFFKQFVKRNPEQAEGMYYLGAILHKQGETESALPVLRRAWKLDPSHKAAAFLLGQLYFYAKDWESLEEVYQGLVAALDEEESRILGQVLGALGVAYFHLKKFPKAVKTLHQAMELNPRDLSSHYHLALAHYAMKNKKTSLTLLKSLRKNLPADSRVLRNVEDLLVKLEEDA
jgi:tetratricopeptide (TPR) repeat protein